MAEPRLIDADALMYDFRRYMAERYDRERCVSEENCKTCERPCLWLRTVIAAPTVDAVPVVYCKDCARYKKGYCTIRKDSWGATLMVGQHDYCSDGERRTDNG